MKAKTSWTKQQENAINARDLSVIVSAAAGSGKTAVLTERLAQLIADESAGIRADRIIIVTFTNDAASELRKRLDAKLRSLIENNPGNKHLLKQQTLLQNARISTINSFCFELLRDNITDQGITSAFTILDEPDNDIIKAHAMDELINYYSSSFYDKISFMYDNFCLKNDEALAEAIRLVDRYLSSAAMREKWLNKAVNEYLNEPFESLYYKKLRESALIKLKEAKLLAKECCDMLDDIFEEDNEIPCAVKSYAQADDDKKRTEKAIEIIENNRCPTETEAEYCRNFERLVTVKKTEPANFAVREFYKIKRKAIISTVKEVISSYDSFEEDFLECREVVTILAEMLRKYHELIWARKCEKNALGFDDGERLVLELLAQEDENGNIVQTETAKKIAEYYDIIMIDEYQDSNNKQDLIFKLISKNYKHAEDGTPLYGDNAFLVGDVKQSIYKFRLANPQNFINTLKHSTPYNEHNSENKNVAITLNKNFRSSEGVIEYVNYIFNNLMSEACGDVSYTSDEMLYFGAKEYEELKQNSCLNERTQITLIKCENDNDDDDTDDDEAVSSTETINPEAEFTAKKIYDMINSKVQVVDKNKQLRSCKASDFCILIRKNKYTKEYTVALGKYGISAKGEEEKGYLSSREIAILLDLLKIIDNPLLDIPLAAVMMSPMFMFEFDEIAYLKTLGRKKPLFTIINRLVKKEKTDTDNISLIRRCETFLEILEQFRLCSVTMTIGQLIGKIYDTTDFIAVMQLYTDGEKKRANLRALIQHARNYEKAASIEGNGGLSGFLRYIDRITEADTDFTQGKISASSGDYVSIKTIHKSKGLEYPFIFLAETSTLFKFDSPSLMCTEDSRIGFVLYNQELLRRYRTQPYKQIKEESKTDIRSEEMRLLYVALTRAKQQLFINLKYSEKRINKIRKLVSDFYLYNFDTHRLACNAQCHADWIWISLFQHREFKKIAERFEIITDELSAPQAVYSENVFEIDYAAACSSETFEAEEKVTKAEPDAAIYTELHKIINSKYDSQLTEVPAKLSVTQIAKKFNTDPDNISFKLKRPDFLKENSSLTGAEKGTAIHTFFQYCDFDAASQNIELERDRMTETGYLSAAQADSINIEKAAMFFKSTLYSRIKKSKSVWREKKFTVAVADLNINSDLPNSFGKSDGMIKGIVDLVFEEDGKLILVDYKSDRKATAEELRERYLMQLKIYKSAMELTTGKVVYEAYLYSFELEKEIKIEI